MSTELAEKETPLSAQIEALFVAKREKFAAALPEGLEVERFERMALTAISGNQDLLTCERGSLLIAVMNAAQIGLELDPNLGHAYLIPRKGRANLQVGYRGFLELALRSERVLSFRAEIVREGDDFEYQMGTGGFVRHVPKVFDPKANKTHVYAIAKVQVGNGSATVEEFDVLPIEECLRIRDKYSDAYKWAEVKKTGRSIWHTDFDSACKKTVLKRLCKLIPCSPRMQRAITIDEATDLDAQLTTAEKIEAAKEVDAKDVTPPPPGAFEDAVGAGTEAEKRVSEADRHEENPSHADSPPPPGGETIEPVAGEAEASGYDDVGPCNPPPANSPAVDPVLSRLRDLYTLSARSKSPVKCRENAMEALDLANGYYKAEEALTACNLSEAVEVESLSVKQCLDLIKKCGELVKGKEA